MRDSVSCVKKHNTYSKSCCKDCLSRHPACHDTCEHYKKFKEELEAQRAYIRQMNGDISCYRYDHEDKHRNVGKKKYFGRNGGAE